MKLLVEVATKISLSSDVWDSDIFGNHVLLFKHHY
jgi:hypothetical protein